MATDLRARLGQAELPNPILTASGCAGSGRELAQFLDVSKIGAVVTKSVMLAPRAGRPTPRMAETPSGMLNSIGLQGPGIDAFLQRDLPWLLSRGARAVVSIAGGTVDEFGELAARLSDAAGVTAIEVNISCPNVEHRAQGVQVDGHAEQGVDQREPVRPGRHAGPGDRDDVGDVRRQLGEHRDVVPGPPSGRWPCGASGRYAKRCPMSRSSAWAAC